MTLEEAKALAERGDVEAMMALADYYSKIQNDENAIAVAFQYYELAANYGEPQAILQMAQTSRMTAGMAMSMIECGERIDSMNDDLEKAHKWAKKLDETFKSLNIQNKDTLEFVKDNLLLAISRLATMYYLDEKYDEVIRITKSVDHPYTQSVYGLAAYQLANTNTEIKEAFNALKNIESDLCWQKEYQTKFGQILLVEAASYLSAIYRVMYNDIDSAYRVMACIAANAIDESIRQDIRESMEKHFKKKIFGGYTYIE